MRFTAAMLLVSLQCLGQVNDAAKAIGILKERCWGCHGQNVSMLGVRLDSRDAVLKRASRLIEAVTHSVKPFMPPDKKLDDAEIATLRDWIGGGANWPEISTTISTWWSFQPPNRPEVPGIKDPWIRTEIDSFILAKFRENKLSPPHDADRRTLIRRAYFDLHGLPPAADRIEKFVNDRSPDAYEKLIDELLASPRYGEKWGRHWLDLVRYGDTAGFEQDPYLLYAWRYRDYVIESFNDDKPYDRFVKEQIAGDELYPDDPPSQSGTGFFTVGPNRDMLYKVEDINRVETLTDFVDTTGSVFLGLTVGCARCHDHKFDPIPQRDYYRLQAIFVPLEKSRVFLQYDPARGYDLAENTRHAKLREVGDQLEALFAPYRKRLRDEKLAALPAEVRDAFATDEARRTPEQRRLVEENGKKIAPSQGEMRKIMQPEDATRLNKIEIQLVGMFTGFKAGPFAPGVRDISREAPKTFLPTGGEVQAGFPAALGGGDAPAPPLDAVSTGRRKALADWIARAGHPLTARVMVNRIWQYHFGQGIVATPSDFGARGSKPSHPELLDWLATEFTSNGWSMKKLHKLIMTSSVYRQAQFSRRRLSPEEIRDAVLQASGDLNLKMGGRPVVTEVDKEELFGISQSADNAWIVTANPEEQHRRSVYLFSKRTLKLSMFETFDAPDGIRSCSRRETSNTAPQSLTMLNSKFTVEQAKRLAARLTSGSTNDADVVRGAWRAVFGRAPEPVEMESAAKLLQSAPATELVRGLFNTNEFLYVD